jgi:dephospho-CoA kinase
MKRILLTGMSGTGKSSVISALISRGFKAVDLDSDVYSEWVAISADSDVAGTPVESDRDWMWREDQVQSLLSTENADVLFVSGCSSNMGKIHAQFDRVILLRAPADVVVERLASRTNNLYGKHPDEVARVLGLMETVEPLLLRFSSHVIDTNIDIEDVVTEVLRITKL